MAKRYDPILCMMVDDSVKTEDRDPYAYEEIKKDIQIMKSGKASYITKNGIIGRISHSFNNRVITKEQKTELMNLVMSVQDAKKVRDSAKAQDELSLAQKKQVVAELKGYLKKSYNFSDESEYARAYEDLRHMFTTGSRKSISGLFENTVKKTGAKDAKAKDKLVKVPDNKLKEFEANLRSAGFKVVSKSDRGMTTHYQVEVNSSKKFTEADLREWANKIDAVCDKMDSVAPTTWNIGLTSDGKITAGLDVREMYVKDSASALDEAIETTDAEGERWITMRGSHVKIDGEGNAVVGNEKVKNIINSGKAGASKESSASENNKQNANKSKADAEKAKKVDNVMKKYGDRHSYSSALRDMLSLSVDIGKKYDEDGIIYDDDIEQYKQKYDKLLDFHMDYDISKTTMNMINTDLVKVLKEYGLDKYQLKSFGWAYTGRDSMPALDKAIKTCDAASGDAMKQIASAK